MLPNTSPVALATPSTLSTEAIYATLRDAILSYELPPNGDTISQICSSDTDRVFIRAQPPKPPFPYICLRLSRQSSGAYNGYRETATLEIQCIGRPESQLPLVERVMDLIDGCFLGYREPVSGLLFSRERARHTLPMFTEPADMSVVGVLAQYSLVIWPLSLINLRPNP